MSRMFRKVVNYGHQFKIIGIEEEIWKLLPVLLL